MTQPRRITTIGKVRSSIHLTDRALPKWASTFYSCRAVSGGIHTSARRSS